jgi:hypothetical protein
MNRASSWSLALVTFALLGSACSEFEVENKPPVAVATAVVGGAPVPAGTANPFMGAPVAVTLCSMGS